MEEVVVEEEVEEARHHNGVGSLDAVEEAAVRVDSQVDVAVPGRMPEDRDTAGQRSENVGWVEGQELKASQPGVVLQDVVAHAGGQVVERSAMHMDWDMARVEGARDAKVNTSLHQEEPMGRKEEG
jgi:hypothetical protein